MAERRLRNARQMWKFKVPPLPPITGSEVFTVSRIIFSKMLSRMHRPRNINNHPHLSQELQINELRSKIKTHQQ